jgi:hypothetical protein
LRGLRITHSNDRIPFPVGSILALSITEGEIRFLYISKDGVKLMPTSAFQGRITQIGQFRSLQALSVVVFTAASLCGLVDTLSQLPGDGLERLRVHTDLDRSDEGLFAELRAFDVRLASSNVMKTTALVRMCPYPGYLISAAHRTRIIDTMAMVGEKWRLEVALQEHGRPGIAVGEMWW